MFHFILRKTFLLNCKQQNGIKEFWTRARGILKVHSVSGIGITSPFIWMERSSCERPLGVNILMFLYCFGLFNHFNCFNYFNIFLKDWWIFTISAAWIAIGSIACFCLIETFRVFDSFDRQWCGLADCRKRVQAFCKCICPSLCDTITWWKALSLYRTLSLRSELVLYKVGWRYSPFKSIESLSPPRDLRRNTHCIGLHRKYSTQTSHLIQLTCTDINSP